MKKENNEKRIIGRKEYISLPEFSMSDIPAKIDSGAYTSSIHVDACREIEKGKKIFLEVKMHGESHKNYLTTTILFPEFRRKKVKSSSGEEEIRYFIKSSIQVGKKIYKTEFSLTDRKKMRFPVLIGRKLLNKHFLIDPSKVYILSKQHAK